MVDQEPKRKTPPSDEEFLAEAYKTLKHKPLDDATLKEAKAAQSRLIKSGNRIEPDATVVRSTPAETPIGVTSSEGDLRERFRREMHPVLDEALLRRIELNERLARLGLVDPSQRHLFPDVATRSMREGQRRIQQQRGKKPTPWLG
jgi:hypothetical protein